jgi:hypothetical protein
MLHWAVFLPTALSSRTSPQLEWSAPHAHRSLSRLFFPFAVSFFYLPSHSPLMMKKIILPS